MGWEGRGWVLGRLGGEGVGARWVGRGGGGC